MNIDDISLEGLLELNALICDRIDYLYAQKDMEALLGLQVGNQVHFESNDGSTVFALVIKINKKTVSVMSKDGKRWKISPGLLTPVKVVDEIGQ